MKIVFLDMDGVVNCMEFFDRTSKEREGLTRHDETDFWKMMIDPEAVKRLNTIADKSGAKFVLSSSWRIAHPLLKVEKYLKLCGFTGDLIDKTPNRSPVPPHRRGNEIQAWLDSHKEVEKFVILDDDSDMEHLTKYLVQTSWRDGLLDEHVEKALKMLE